MPSYVGLTAATTAAPTRIFGATNMAVGAYALTQTTPTWSGGGLVTISHTAVGAADTLGTIVVVGTDVAGNARTETITPLNGTTATGTIGFRTITSMTGVGWVINAGNDTITAGFAAGSIACSTDGTLWAVIVNTTAAGTVVLSDSKGTLATLKASIAEGHYLYGGMGVDFTGYLKVALTVANDVTVVTSAPMRPAVSL